MKKVIRDNQERIIGWSNTNLKLGSYTEFCDGARYTYRGFIAEPLKNLDADTMNLALEKGELF